MSDVGISVATDNERFRIAVAGDMVDALGSFVGGSASSLEVVSRIGGLTHLLRLITSSGSNFGPESLLAQAAAGELFNEILIGFNEEVKNLLEGLVESE